MSEAIPRKIISRERILISKNIKLADSEYHKLVPIEMLLGSGPTVAKFCIGQINLSNEINDLCLQKNKFGWLNGGTLKMRKPIYVASCNVTDIKLNLEKLWET